MGMARADRIQPRSVLLSGAPSAISFSNVDDYGEGLLAVSVGREVRLIRRQDLKGCGTFALNGCKEAGLMALSADGSVAAIVPMTDSGALTSKIQFYATEAKTKPVVAAIRSEGLVSIDFLHVSTSKNCGTGCIVAACGVDLCQVAPTTGDIVASWYSSTDRTTFTHCKAVSAYEVVTLADRCVEVWDLRTADGMVLSTKASEPMTAIDASVFCISSEIFLGDALGALHRIDWRSTTTTVLELLWSPPKERGRSPPAHTVMHERGCICLMAGYSLTMLAIDPCVVELGCSDGRGQLTSVAAGPGAWAFGTQAFAGSKSQAAVVVVESNGEAQQYQRAEQSPDTDFIETKKKPKRLAKTFKRLPCRLANR